VASDLRVAQGSRSTRCMRRRTARWIPLLGCHQEPGQVHKQDSVYGVSTPRAEDLRAKYRCLPCAGNALASLPIDYAPMPTDHSSFAAADYAAPALSNREARPNLAVASALVIILLLVYVRVCRFGFMGGDDSINVLNNPHLNPPTWRGLLFFWQHSYYLLYTPVTYTLYWVQAAAGSLLSEASGRAVGPPGLNPHLFHTVNLCFHVLNVFLVYALLRCLVQRDWAAGRGGAAVWYSPGSSRAGSVDYWVQQPVVGHFCLVALLQYTRFARAQCAGGAQSAARRHYLWATVAFAMALLSKPIAVMVPAMAWVIDRWMVGRGARSCTRSLLPWLGLAALCVWVTEAAQTTHVLGHAPFLMRPFRGRRRARLLSV